MGLPAICEGDLRLVKNAPRVLDIRLAEALEFAQSRDIRKLIQTNLNELAGYSEVCAVATQTSEQGGRPGKEYWLTEEQALLICMRSDAPRALVAEHFGTSAATVARGWDRYRKYVQSGGAETCFEEAERVEALKNRRHPIT